MDDLDQLLEEAEVICGRNRAKQTSMEKGLKGKSDVEEDVSRMLEEFDCIDKPPHSSLNNPTSLPKPHVVDVSRKQRLVCWPATMPRCSAVLLCPASSARGRCSLSSPRACHLLLCLTCNLAVVSFDGIAWLETTDYLFLRNNMPDLHRLKGQPSKWLHSSYYLSQPVYEVKQDVERMLANVRYLAIYSSYPTCQPFPLVHLQSIVTLLFAVEKHPGPDNYRGGGSGLGLPWTLRVEAATQTFHKHQK